MIDGNAQHLTKAKEIYFSNATIYENSEEERSLKRSSPFYKFLNDDQNMELNMMTDEKKLAEIDKLVLSKK